jgi:hypothetical protein
MGADRMSGNRVSVYEAAEVLDLTVDAIRKRIQRGTIVHERDEDDRVWVLLDASSKVQDADQDTYQTPPRDELIDELRDQVRFLREELARKDAILLRMAESIPQIEAPQEQPPESPETATEQPGRVGPQAPLEGAQEEPAQPRSWWRVFGG